MTPNPSFERTFEGSLRAISNAALRQWDAMGRMRSQALIQIAGLTGQFSIDLDVP
jgi:hypothetical protein